MAARRCWPRPSTCGSAAKHTKFRFLAAAYGRINSTWTLPNQVGWPIAKELLFTARIVEAEEAYRIGLLNHLVPRAQLRAKTMEIAKMIAANHRGAVVGIKALMLQQMAQGLEEQFNAEQEYTTHVLRGAKAKDAFPEFIERRGWTSKAEVGRRRAEGGRPRQSDGRPYISSPSLTAIAPSPQRHAPDPGLPSSASQLGRSRRRDRLLRQAVSEHVENDAGAECRRSALRTTS